MSDNEINVAIAEACGWKDRADGDSKYIDQAYEKRMYLPSQGRSNLHPPNYCTDLNAMHGAWLTLDSPHQHAFWGHLHAVLGGRETNFKAANATARDRAEAFLRTVGKWQEEA